MVRRLISSCFSFLTYHLEELLSKLGLCEPVGLKISAILEDLEFVKRTQQRIQAVLQDAEEDGFRGKSFELWQRDLGELLYEADDLIDLYKYQMMAKEIEEDEVCIPYLSSSSSSSSSTFSSSPLVDLQFRYEIVDGVSKFKKKFEEISMQKDNNFQPAYRQRSGKRSDTNELVTSSNLETSSIPTEKVMIGRDVELWKLVQQLLQSNGDELEEFDDREPTVIAVVGMGGVGKTTLAQHAYNDPKVCNHENFNIRGWVCVSDDFDVACLTEVAIESLTKKPCPNLKGLDSLQNCLKDVVKGKKFLLVMDDVWNEDPMLWEKFMNPFRTGGAIGSKILITTRNQSVIDAARIVEPSLQLEHLSEEDGWSLFERHAFHNRSIEPELLDIGLQIVQKCKGLPLAIKVLASVLQQKAGTNDEVRRWRAELNSDFWDTENTTGWDILGLLQLSYLHLPYHLKRCFKLCSTLPKGHPIKKLNMVSLWMAHDLIKHDQMEGTMNVGMKYIDDFMSMSFFQSHAYGPDYVQMHDLIHDLAKHVSGAECHSTKKDEPLNLPADARHASILRPLFGSDLILSNGNASGLRTLMVSSEDCGNIVRITINKELGGLRVLVLQNITIKVLAPDFFQYMKSLRYLNLAGASIDPLPESMFKLYHLQLLVLSYASVQQLPDSVGNLKSLKYLDLSHNPIEELPQGLFSLYNLEVLELSNTGIRQLSDCINNLKRLRHLGLWTQLKVLPMGITMLHNLQSLHLTELIFNKLPDKSSLRSLHISTLPPREMLVEECGIMVARYHRESIREKIRVALAVQRAALDFIAFAERCR